MIKNLYLIQLQEPNATAHFIRLATLLIGLLVLLFILHISFGSVAIPPLEVVATLRHQSIDPVHQQIIWNLRLPRALIAMTSGALLGLAGAILQSVLRNPLAEPGLTGVSGGAVLASVIMLSTGQALALPDHFLPLVALMGGLLAGLLVYILSWRGRSDPLRFALTGILLSAVLSSATTLFLLLSTEGLGGILVWMIGSLNGRVWLHWSIIWPWACVALPLGLLSAGIANVLQLGDEVAAGLGLRVEFARAILFGIAAFLTAGAVAVIGGLGFIGLIGPHIARRLVGDDARHVFSLSMLLAAVLLLGADVIAQGLTIHTTIGGVDTRSGLPVGAVTALLGAPFFLYLLKQHT